jgi:hypothetical protein
MDCTDYHPHHLCNLRYLRYLRNLRFRQGFMDYTHSNQRTLRHLLPAQHHVLHPAGALTLRADEPQPGNGGLVRRGLVADDGWNPPEGVMLLVRALAEVLGGEHQAGERMRAQAGYVRFGLGDQFIGQFLAACGPAPFGERVRTTV